MIETPVYEDGGDFDLVTSPRNRELFLGQLNGALRRGRMLIRLGRALSVYCDWTCDWREQCQATDITRGLTDPDENSTLVPRTASYTRPTIRGNV